MRASNAYKFTSSGSVTVKAIAERQNDKDITITIAVKDTGVGISEAAQKKLFLPFSQADSSTARQFGGTGLGLSICKAICETAMHGKIWMESEVGVGTTVAFTITFPKVVKGSISNVRQERPDPMAAFSPQNDPSTPLDQVSTPPPFDLAGVPKSKIKVLIAEDNGINATIARSYVKKAGYQPEVFENGQLAFEALIAASKAGSPFHLVLMDCQMPVLDGYDATREIRKHPDPLVRNVTIVAMTASAIRGDREACLAAGMNNYLSKPVKQKVLQNLLEGYLEKSEAMQQATGIDEEMERGSNGNKRMTVG
jgi:CheY-like chemotaxis protein